MLSAIVATRDSERPLVHTLACLVPGATAGLVREVIVADAGSRDETAEVADIAGCRLIVSPGSFANRLKAAAAAARGPWLLFLPAGVVLDANWVAEAMRFLGETRGAPDACAAVFRAAPSAERRGSLLGQPLRLLRLGRRRGPGLLIARGLYQTLGGHRDANDPETELVGRIGRRRVVVLGCAALVMGPRIT